MFSSVILILLVRFALLIRGKSIILLILSIFVGSLELLSSNIAFLLFEVFSARGICKHNTVLVIVDIDLIVHFPLIIQVSLSILVVLVIPFAILLIISVCFTTALDLICKFGVFVCNLDLLLQSLLLVFKFPQSVFHHLSLDNYMVNTF